LRLRILASRRRQQPFRGLLKGNWRRSPSGSDAKSINANHPLIRAGLARAALVNVVVAGALVLAACTVAALAFELENQWTLPTSLFVAGACSFLAARNLYTYRLSLKGIR
jgi:hypothetical protein